jgi:hypothetical protein
MLPAIALDENLAQYSMKHFEEEVPDIRNHHVVTMDGNSYGVITSDEGIKEMLTSFFKTNEDNRATMLHEITNENYVSIIPSLPYISFLNVLYIPKIDK